MVLSLKKKRVRPLYISDVLSYENRLELAELNRRLLLFRCDRRRNKPRSATVRTVVRFGSTRPPPKLRNGQHKPTLSHMRHENPACHFDAEVD